MPKKSSKRRTFGYIRKLPSGRYQASYTDAKNIRRVAASTFDTKQAADTWLASMQTDMARGQWLNPDLGRITLGEYLTNWLAAPPRPLRATTREGYEYLAKRFIFADLDGMTLAHIQLSALTAMQIREWHGRVRKAAVRPTEPRRRQTDEQLARVWAQAQGMPLPPSGRLPRRALDAWKAAGCPVEIRKQLPASRGQTMTAQAYRLLHAVLNTATDEGCIGANPCRIKGGGNVKADERQPLTVDELRRVCLATAPRYQAAVWVSGWTGLRRGELFGLARKHVNVEACTLRIERQVVKTKADGLHFGEPKTQSSKRTVTVPKSVMDVLEAHMQAYVPNDPEAIVFTTETGGLVCTSRSSDIFRKARQQAGIPESVRWHDLRHTGQTLAAESGATVSQLMARMGHSTERMAMYYMHNTASADRDLAGKLDLKVQASGALILLDDFRQLRRDVS